MFGGNQSGGGLDMFGGGGSTSKEFGRSSAESVIGGDTRGLNLDTTAVITISAVVGVVLLVVALTFGKR